MSSWRWIPIVLLAACSAPAPGERRAAVAPSRDGAVDAATADAATADAAAVDAVPVDAIGLVADPDQPSGARHARCAGSAHRS